MVSGAKVIETKYGGKKQLCICGAKLPLHYNVHLGCEGKPKDVNQVEGIYEDAD